MRGLPEAAQLLPQPAPVQQWTLPLLLTICRCTAALHALAPWTESGCKGMQGPCTLMNDTVNLQPGCNLWHDGSLPLWAVLPASFRD